MEYFIKEAAKKLNVSSYTLRYYDKEELTPFLKKDKNGVRIYTDEDLEWIKMLLNLRDIDMPIKKIKEYIDLYMISKNAKEERMKKLHRINLDKYIPIIKKKRNILMSHIYEIVKIKSDDNLNLKGILFKREGSKKIVICFHEY